MTIHFNVHMDPSKGPIRSEDIKAILRQEIVTASNSTTAQDSVLGDLAIDEESLEVQGKNSN